MMLHMVDFTYSTELFLVADQRPYTWKNLHFTNIPHLQTLPQVKNWKRKLLDDECHPTPAAIS